MLYEVITVPIETLLGERRVHLHSKPSGFIGTFVV